MTSEIAGQCLCHTIRFSGQRVDSDVVACHCGQCRCWSGHVWASVQVTDLRITGEGALRWFRSGQQSERGFCSNCGASLFYRVDGRKDVSVAAGAIQAPTGLAMRGHIFVADKGDYYDITDGLPEYPGSDL